MRFLAPVFFAAALATTLAFATAPARAQAADNMPPAAGEKAKAPESRADRLNWLYTQLAAASAEDAGKRIANQIAAIYIESGSDTINLLMARALKSMGEKDYALALDLLDQVVTLKPDYVEGWNKRATVHFTQQNYGRALADIERVLALEPRHFGALSGLGMILNELEDKKRALAVFQRVLEIYPSLENAKKAMKELELERREREI